MLVNPFIADVEILSVFQPSSYLIWAPILVDQLLNPNPGFKSYVRLINIPPDENKFVHFFGSVSVSA